MQNKGRIQTNVDTIILCYSYLYILFFLGCHYNNTAEVSDFIYGWLSSTYAQQQIVSNLICC